MESIRYALLAILLITFSALGAQNLPVEMMGGHEAGGGTSITKTSASEPLLLDLAIFNNDFIDTYNIDSTLPLKNGSFSLKLRLEIADIKSSATYDFLAATLFKWKDVAPSLVSSVLDTIGAMNFIPVDGYLNLDTKESLGVNLSNLKKAFPSAVLHRAATYTYSDGALLSLPVWNSLGDYSRASLLVHEALRRSQILAKDSISTSQIVKLTGALILGHPDSLKLNAYLPKSMALSLKEMKTALTTINQVRLIADELDGKFNVKNFNSLKLQDQINFLLALKSELFQFEVELMLADSEKAKKVRNIGKVVTGVIDQLLIQSMEKFLVDIEGKSLRAGNPAINTLLYFMSDDFKEETIRGQNAIFENSKKNQSGVGILSL